MDFNKFTTHAEHRARHPRDLFSALPKPGVGFGYLRDVQGQVLDGWVERRNDRDVAIKMNTGTGKTVVGLIVLACQLAEGHGPALYVAPDNFLAQQVGRDASALGIEWTDDPESPEYSSGRSIGIVNIHKLINGRSIFGGPGNNRIDPVRVGALVVDDAHACVTTVEDQSTVVIHSEHPVYQLLFSMFRGALESQSRSKLADLEDDVPGVVLRVPIDAWSAHVGDVIDAMQPHRNDDQFKFAWSMIRDILPTCQAVFSNRSLEIRPHCPPTNLISGFDHADRRTYLTATLADDSVLVSHFSASELCASNPITPGSAADIGDRLILSPMELNASVREPEIRESISELSAEYNVVVLVPSFAAAQAWADHAAIVAGADQIEVAVSALRDAHVGLVVLVNKYDGVDLPGDACRVLVLDGLPQAHNNIERREAELLGGSEVLQHRQLQRIEQGMGRGVRSAEDHCVIYVIGTGLARIVAAKSGRDRLGPATRAQLELSRSVAEELAGAGLDEIKSVARQCLTRDDGWLNASRNCLIGTTYGKGSVSAFASGQRMAFEAAVAGQFEVASQTLSAAINAIDDARTKGWLQEHLAGYVQELDPTRAQRILAGAIKFNPRVLRPLKGVSYQRPSSSANQTKSAALAFSDHFASSSDLVLGVNALTHNLEFDPTRTADFENAIELLGTLLGFQSQRPERNTDNGPDNLWSVGNLSFFVIECKSGSQSLVWRSDVEQLSHSLNWFKEQFDESCIPTPILIHPTGELAPDAVAPEGTRVLTAAGMKRLTNELRGLASALSSRGAWDQASDFTELLTHHGLLPAEFVSRYTFRLR